MHAVGGVAGLLLQVSPTGSRSWILRATVGCKRRDMGLGAYPDVTLAEARESARHLRTQIREGIDPIAEREAARQALIASQRAQLSFAEAARRKHAAIALIELPHVMNVLQPIWTTKTETASRVRQRMEAVFSWAIVSGHRKAANPAEWRGNLAEVLPAPAKIKKVKHHPALPWADVPAFMVRLRQRHGMSARALEFLILTASRSKEVRLATWDEFHLDAAVWTVPGERIKAGKTHRVPLCEDALAILAALPTLDDSPYVFASRRGGPMSDMSLRNVTKRMAVEAVPHGFRSSFKDWARNCCNAADEVSELAMAHVNSDATRAAYARDELLAPRRRMMVQWERFCRGQSNDLESNQS